MSSVSDNLTRFISKLVHGLWNPWAAWSECSTTCENGTRTRSRTCDGPYNGGEDCNGAWNETEGCFLIMCPGNCFIHVSFKKKG